MSETRKTPVIAAIGYPRCTNCGALRGDPCRTPAGRTRFPHDERNTAARYAGILPWWEPAKDVPDASLVPTTRARKRRLGV